MTLTEPTVAGWYQDPLKPERLRYWDGAEWSDQTAEVETKAERPETTMPDGAVPSEAHSGRRRPTTKRRWSKKMWALIGIATGCVVIAGIIAATSLNLPALIANSNPSPSPSTTSRITADGSLPEDATDEEIQEYIDSLPPLVDASDTTDEDETDKWMENQGYQTAIAGNVYIKPLQSSDFTCGYLSCTYYAVYVEKGCPSGVFIQGSIDANGTSVGPVNAHTAALAPQSTATFSFEDYTNQGDGFHITGVNCYP